MIDENFIYFFKLTIGSKNIGLNPNLKILSCFAPNLTPLCERCVLTYSHHFDGFYMERQP
jgi:hypothetical protein